MHWMPVKKSTSHNHRDLVYSFPMKELFKVVFADVYMVGDELSFQGYKHYIAACNGISSFAAVEGLETDKTN
eukprot:279224-Ditylum_brightwellii.AAC.1